MATSDIFNSDSDIPSATPIIFQSVGPKDKYYQWQATYHNEFVSWWIDTQWAVTRVAIQIDVDLIKRLGWNTSRPADCWKSFDQVAKISSGEPLLLCKHCHTLITHPSTTITNSGTSGLRHHLNTARCSQQRNSSSTTQTVLNFSAPHAPKALTQELFNAQVLRTIISMRAPFRSVEDLEWKALCYMQNPNFRLPSEKTIRRCLTTQLAEVEATFLQNVVPGSKIAISLDCWSSPTRLSFMGIIAHYINASWELKSELIGFEQLSEVHTGKELADVLNSTITRVKFQNRVSSITTDNASNNTTLVSNINALLEEAFVENRFLDGTVQHIPCLSHVLQLAMQALLGSIRVRPTNKDFIRNWEESQLNELRNSEFDTDGIPFLLAKIRQLAIFANSSGQRKARFNTFQREIIEEAQSALTVLLVLLLDVSTRWDSTCLMLIRALRLRPTIDRFCQDYSPARPFSLTDEEWEKLSYLIDITRPFAFFTQQLGKTKSVTIPYAMATYDRLFERLNESHRRLTAKKTRKPWVQPLLKGILAAQEKLDKYYNKMYTNLGSLYAIAAILNPSTKLESFNEDYCWLDPSKKDWKIEYEQQFRSLFERSYSGRGSSDARRLSRLRDESRDPLALILDRSRLGSDLSSQLSTTEVDEPEHWLQLRNDTRDPLVVWKSLQFELPGLAAMARDVLCIPMAGVGVERAFSFARNHLAFNRGQLLPVTIRAILLVYWSLIESHSNDTQKEKLRQVLDVNSMTADEITNEVRIQEEELGSLRGNANFLDEDQYISDEEPQPGATSRTARLQLKANYHFRMQLRRDRNFRHETQPRQELSLDDRLQQEALVLQLAIAEQRSRANPEIFDVPSSPPLIERRPSSPALERATGALNRALQQRARVPSPEYDLPPHRPEFLQAPSPTSFSQPTIRRKKRPSNVDREGGGSIKRRRLT